MLHSHFIQSIEKILKPEQAVMDGLVSSLESKTYRKGDFLLKADETCKYFYFIEKGLVKLFFDNGDKDFIMTFFAENVFFAELSGFLIGQPSKYMIVALEPTEVLRIHKDIIEGLCKKHHTAETLFSKLYSKAPVNMMEKNSAVRLSFLFSFLCKYSPVYRDLNFGLKHQKSHGKFLLYCRVHHEFHFQPLFLFSSRK